MRILFVLHNFLPEPIFGTEQVCIQQMRVLLSRGYRVGLFYACNKKVTEKQIIDYGLRGLECFPVKFHETKGQVLLSVVKPYADRLFNKALDRFNPDVVIYQHLVRLSMNLPLISRNRNIASILYLHDFYLICPSYSLLRPDQGLCSGPGLYKCPACLFEAHFHRLKPFSSFVAFWVAPLMLIRRLMVKRILRAVSIIVSPSKFLANKMKNYGLLLQKVHIIPNGSDLLTGHKLLPPKRKKDIQFGYMGSIIPKKGVDLLADAFSGKLGDHLIIRGFSSKSDIDRFQQKNPHFRGSLECFNPDKSSFFNAVDVVIVPSVWYENQPTVVIEAFEHGKPVICSDCGALPEMVEDNVSGLLFKTGDPVDLRAKVQLLIDQPMIVDRLVSGIPQWPSVSDNIDRLSQHFIQ